MRDTRRFTMPAQVWCKDMPAQAERWNQRQKYLPPPAQSVKQHKRWPIVWTLGIIELNLTVRSGGKLSLNQSCMILTQDFSARRALRAKLNVLPFAPLQLSSEHLEKCFLKAQQPRRMLRLHAAHNVTVSHRQTDLPVEA